MQEELRVGESSELTWTVGSEHTIDLGHDAIVFSTPSMIRLMEHAARNLLARHIDPGQASVGMDVNVSHLAATPAGGRVTATATVTAIDGSVVEFDVVAHDQSEQIGRGTHRRAVIDVNRFASRVRKKMGLKNMQLSTGTPADRNPIAGDLPNLETITVSVSDKVAKITLNRPKTLNAVNTAMTEAWEVVLNWLTGHPDDVRVVILTGAGDAFCAGDDVKELAFLSSDQARELSLQQARIYLGFEKIPQPIVAAVNGVALGAGCVCAVAADFRIAGQMARFGMPEIALGWAPGYGVAQLTRLVGKARALELCLTAKTITAQEAYAWGLVGEVVPQNQLMARAEAVARQLVTMSPIALRETKRLIHADEGQVLKETYLDDTEAYMRCFESEDAKEGISAFGEKRPAKFHGQ